MKVTKVSLIGSTGSIGTQAVDVILANPDQFSVVALAAQSSLDLLVEQAKALHPDLVVIGDPTLVDALVDRLPSGIEVLCGSQGLEQAATQGDTVVNAVVGFAGLPVTIGALRAGKRLALANKESLIAAAPIVRQFRSTPGAEIVPVDSEHCAIHQCLQASGNGHLDSVARLVITASGGPFHGRSRLELSTVGIDEALSHPTWKMGKKITIDSSTLMNKGLEVIEAHELFGVSYDQIDVVVHPQSIVHSMVEMVDGAVIAQMSEPDMRLAIGYAISWPNRLSTAFGAIDFTKLGPLTFEAPDRSVFTCLGLAYEAGRQGGTAPAWLNAANEVAVAAFLEGGLDWIDIASVIQETLESCSSSTMNSVEDVLEADRKAREVASRVVERKGSKQ